MTHSPHSLPRKEAALILTPEALHDAEQALAKLDWGEDGLTRDEIHDLYPHLSPSIYLRLPASKRFTSVQDVLLNVADSPVRAEGEIPGESAESPEADSIEDGGPPAWGPDPLYSYKGKEDGGSAEDTEELFLPEENVTQDDTSGDEHDEE
ncbi:MAG TPA: hypothetical protein VF040_09340 [Ktedonobacterales bacterium]